MSDEEDIEWTISFGKYGFDVPIGDAYIKVNGNQIDPPMDAEVPIEALFHFTKASLQLFSKTAKTLEDLVDEEVMKEFKARAFQATMVLVGLGLGKYPNTSIDKIIDEVIEESINRLKEEK